MEGPPGPQDLGRWTGSQRQQLPQMDGGADTGLLFREGP